MHLKPNPLFYLVLMVFTFSNAFGTLFKAEETVTINQKQEADLYMAGETLRIMAPVNGDVIGAGAKVILADSIYEDVMVAGGDLEINGWIGDDVRITGGNIYINGQIQGDLVMAGGNLHVGPSAEINGTAVVSGGKIKFEGTALDKTLLTCGSIKFLGTIKGPANLKSEDIKFNGTASEPIKLAAESIKIGDNATFYRDVNYWQKGGQMDLSPYLKEGANAQFDTNLSSDRSEDVLKFLGLGLAGMVIYWFLSLLGGFVLVLFFTLVFRPNFAQLGMFIGNHLGSSILAGLIYLVVTPVLVIVLFATIIGIPLGLLGLALYAFSIGFAKAITAIILAYWLKQRNNYQWTTSITILISLVIFLILKILSFIPFLGWLVNFVVILGGLGSIVYYIFKQTQEKQALNKG